MIKELIDWIKKEENRDKAKILQGFFKTGVGEYGEGDIFLGITVPIQRKIVKEFKEIPIQEIQELLDSKIHEMRLIGLLILDDKYKTATKEKNQELKSKIFEFYLKNTKNINNWDLVDLTSPNIVGDYLIDKDRKILYGLANSSDLWKKRIAIVATFTFIRNKEFRDTLNISDILINDKHDLIHKACGWMLREIWKKDPKVLEDYLKDRYKKMPRTMLRYAIEKFPEETRKRYLKGEV